jgi:hypothetical protein
MCLRNAYGGQWPRCDVTKSAVRLARLPRSYEKVSTKTYTCQNQSLNDVKSKSRCLFWDPYKTLKTKRAPRRILGCLTWWYVKKPLDCKKVKLVIVTDMDVLCSYPWGSEVNEQVYGQLEVLCKLPHSNKRRSTWKHTDVHDSKITLLWEGCF